MSDPTPEDITKTPQGTETVPASGPAPLKTEPEPAPEPEKKPEPKPEPKAEPAKPTRRTYPERFRAFFLDKR